MILIAVRYVSIFQPLQPDEFVKLYESSEILAMDSTNSFAEMTGDRRPLKSDRAVKRFKDIDVKRIKESTQLIGNGTRITGPLDRKDIFYSATLALLPEYNKEKRSMETTDPVPISYHLSMIHESELNSATGYGHVSHLIRCALRLLFDVTILKSPAFLTFAMSNFFYVFGLYVPYMFIKSKFA